MGSPAFVFFCFPQDPMKFHEARSLTSIKWNSNYDRQIALDCYKVYAMYQSLYLSFYQEILQVNRYRDSNKEISWITRDLEQELERSVKYIQPIIRSELVGCFMTYIITYHFLLSLSVFFIMFSLSLVCIYRRIFSSFRFPGRLFLSTYLPSQTH